MILLVHGALRSDFRLLHVRFHEVEANLVFHCAGICRRGTLHLYPLVAHQVLLDVCFLCFQHAALAFVASVLLFCMSGGLEAMATVNFLRCGLSDSNPASHAGTALKSICRTMQVRGQRVTGGGCLSVHWSTI